MQPGERVAVMGTPLDPKVTDQVKGAIGNAQKKLLIAICLCSTFMVAELVAGFWAHSLAILTDAAHMLSDVCSFGISLFAIFVSVKPGTVKMSFGYARAEILGALVSILAIWALTIWLVAEAVNRILNPQKVNAPIMVYTAVFGIVTNITLATVLDHHHSHHHSHTHSHSHLHEHQLHKSDSSVLHKRSADSLENPENTCEEKREVSGSSPSGSIAFSEIATPSAGAAAESYRVAASMLKDFSRRSIAAPCDLTKRQSKSKEMTSVEDLYLSIDEEMADHRKCSNDEDASQQYYLQHPLRHAAAPGKGNINISAAYLHALGDLFQNLGVLVGGLVIWWKPAWTVADPICTLMFSVVVFSTTIGILKDAANVLMEGTPAGTDPGQIVSELRTLKNVIEVHDVHVWSLSMGKPALACHIVIDEPSKAKRVLAAATSLIQVKHMILHTTIQIDFSTNKSSCETDAHVKCH
eukprot:Gregarina_sp_Poly_1__9945@NODE_656_length_6918_cov_257_889943_g498_i0_p2_GENE_NODE_656_length_6918_cov_257_889943_g498_i0NODE_656_length_6918_cov_257_889943_g498_i0_p2_ORF_typecomplete_len467_score38_93Cation_efflux/PF01545_21/4_3e62Herpes_LMP1/PF05297_11/0_0065DUF1980/PF09323_10/0_78NicO/PF03824_16/1_1DUF973/PF06157_11/1_3DUF973/PF06157_11/2_3e02DUF1129/PF06570_11/5_NODE_656_length_6918_cov_257_889943_g498_i052706670